MISRSIDTWLNPKLVKAQEILSQGKPVLQDKHEELYLGIDLGTCDVVSMVVNKQGEPVAVKLDWADVVRDGIVWNFFAAVEIIKRQLALLQEELGVEFTEAATSFPPGTNPRISINVIEAAGLKVSQVIDEPSAVAQMMQLNNAAVVDIGGGTTGIAVIKQGEVIYSGDEATGGHHVSLTIAGNLKITEEQAEEQKKARGAEVWPIVRPVFEKMVSIVENHLTDYQVDEIYLSGGSCMLPGVADLFSQSFVDQKVILPVYPIFVTPLAIAVCGMEACNARK